jgi:hypothetical protein
MHDVAEGHETPSKPSAVDGTARETQVSPPSPVERRPRRVPPLDPKPPPATAQFVAFPHEMAFKPVVAGGTGRNDHDAPLSLLEATIPDEGPSGTVDSPTSRHWECVAHVMLVKYGTPGGALPLSLRELCFQVDPPLAVVMMLSRLPPLGSPMMASTSPSAMQERRVVQVTKCRVSSPLGTLTVFQLRPALFEVTAIALVIAVVTPTAIQKVLVGHESATSLPTPLGSAGASVHEFPPSSVRITAPRSPLP